VFPPEWRRERERAAQGAALALTAAAEDGVSAREVWELALPELFGEVELDLAATGLIADLDRALDTRPWHFVRAAVERLVHIEDTWTWKAVRDAVRRRSDRIPDHDGREAGLPPRSGRR